MPNKNTKNIVLRRLMEYSAFFPDTQPLDVLDTLRQFNRNILLRMALVLSNHYGNLFIPDSKRTLFSDISCRYIPYLNWLLARFWERNSMPHGTEVAISTNRTALEFFKHIYSIPVDEYKNTIKEEDSEYILFKVLLTLNEKLAKIKKSDECKYKLDELLYLNSYLTNDTINYEFETVLQTQIYYAYQLSQLCDRNEKIRAASHKLFASWGIHSWKQYIATIIYLADQTDQYFKKQQGGVPTFNIYTLIKGDKTGLLSKSLIEELSIDENALIPYEKDNEDYRQFRSHPIIRFTNGDCSVINNELLCERLYNSLYFDFQPLIKGGKDAICYFDYNKEFVEKALFRNTMIKAVHSSCFTFPMKTCDSCKESPNEPDYYIRDHSNLIIFECKAIKMNGIIRDEGDYSRLLDELHEKIVIKTKNLNPSRKKFKGGAEGIGIGQLMHHIQSIDADLFQWDTDIPEVVTYYPIIVFEDTRILQPGLLSIINRWFLEEMKKNIKDNQMPSHILAGCMPVMALSINTIYLYDYIFRKRGFAKVIDEFVGRHATLDKDGNYVLNEDSDFDGWLHTWPYYKKNDIGKWLIGKG